jgi:hypothetical protein
MGRPTYRASTRPRSVVATRGSIVGDERHDNSGVAGLILDILHVVGVREGYASSATVLVLRLPENHRAAVGDLMLSDDLSDVGDVAA